MAERNASGENLARSRFGMSGGAGVATRLTACAAIWWVLTGGDGTAWLWGLPAIVAAVCLNPFPPAARWRWRVAQVPIFAAVFVRLSLLGAFDVGWRALHPRCPLRPVLVEYLVRLPAGPARLFLAHIINLMPGTLCVRIAGEGLTVHVLANPERVVAGLQVLEAHVARLFGVTLDGND